MKAVKVYRLPEDYALHIVPDKGSERVIEISESDPVHLVLFWRDCYRALNADIAAEMTLHALWALFATPEPERAAIMAQAGLRFSNEAQARHTLYCGYIEATKDITYRAKGET